jgi:hypothetical protein
MLLTAYEARPDAPLYQNPADSSDQDSDSPQKRDYRDVAKNDTFVPESAARLLHKRSIDHRSSELWHLSMLSWDTEIPFSDKHTFTDGVVHDPEHNLWASQWDDSQLGLGQTVYVMEAGWESGDVSTLRTCF